MSEAKKNMKKIRIDYGYPSSPLAESVGRGKTGAYVVYINDDPELVTTSAKEADDMFRAVADDCIVDPYCQTRSPEWRLVVERDAGTKLAIKQITETVTVDEVAKLLHEKASIRLGSGYCMRPWGRRFRAWQPNYPSVGNAHGLLFNASEVAWRINNRLAISEPVYVESGGHD